MYTYFTIIINILVALDNIYSNLEIEIKILNSLPNFWGVITIFKIKDLTKFDINELIEVLITHD